MTPALRAIPLGGGLRPTVDFRFTDGALDPRVSVAVGSGGGGTITNAAGTIALATASAPRFDYNPVTLTPAGILVETPSTNLLLNSLLNGTNLSTQSVTVTAQAYTLSFYGTGTVTLSGTFAGSLVGSGVYPGRGKLTFTPTAGTLTLTVTGTVQYASLEAGSFATSETPTAGSSATRNVDAITMAGGNLSWFNHDSGTFVVEFDTIYSGNAPATHGLIGMGASQRFIYVGSGGNSPSSYDGTTILNGAATNVTNGAVHKIASAYDGANRALCTDAGAVATAAQAAGYTSGTTMYIGGYASGDAWNGHLRRIRYWPKRLPDATLQRLTA